jgi:hypothetical protein
VKPSQPIERYLQLRMSRSDRAVANSCTELLCVVLAPPLLSGQRIVVVRTPGTGTEDCYSAPLPQEWSTLADQGELELEVHEAPAPFEAACAGRVLGIVMVSTVPPRGFDRIRGGGEWQDSDFSSDGSSDGMFTAVEVVPDNAGGAVEEANTAKVKPLDSHTADGDPVCTARSDEDNVSRCSDADNCTNHQVRSFNHVSSHLRAGSQPSGTTSGKSGHYTAAALRCISEESAGTEPSGRSPGDGTQHQDQDKYQVAVGCIVSTAGVIIGRAEITTVPAQHAPVEPTQSPAGSPFATSPADESREVRVVAEGYCHLFRASVADCRALEEHFLLSRRPVEQRLDAIS